MATKSYLDTLEDRVIKTRHYAGELEKALRDLRSDQLALKTGIIVLSVVLTLVLYEWLVAGALSCRVQ